ncbi:hypothetical protein HYR53_04335 [Candidatus Acetothermia bacterium]|nr:hypothetical protein [Candidatus Acetothermia bacterium]
MYSRELKIADVVITSSDIRKIGERIYQEGAEDRLQKRAVSFEVYATPRVKSDPTTSLEILREALPLNSKHLTSVRIFFRKPVQQMEIELSLAQQILPSVKKKNFLRVEGPDARWVDSLFEELSDLIESWQKQDIEFKNRVKPSSQYFSINFVLIYVSINLDSGVLYGIVVGSSDYVHTHWTEAILAATGWFVTFVCQSDLILALISRFLLPSLPHVVLIFRVISILAILLVPLIFLSRNLWKPVLEARKAARRGLSMNVTLAGPEYDELRRNIDNRNRRLSLYFSKYGALIILGAILLGKVLIVQLMGPPAYYHY